MAIYQLFIYIYVFLFRIYAIFNSKAKEGWEARKNLFKRLEQNLTNQKNNIWFHCASLGEFEQGRPLIEKIKTEHPEKFIFLTFFSYSGYSVQKNYPFADYIDYIPFDTNRNAQKLIELIHPELVVFVKYEFWWNIIQAIELKKIRIILISGIFREKQYFFKWFGGHFKSLIEKFTFLYVQDQNSAEVLQKYGILNFEVTGDTRIDRVMSISKSAKQNEIIASFKSDKKLLIAGSTWEKDEQFLVDLVPVLSEDWKLVIAPHEIHRKYLEHSLIKKNIDFCLYTYFSNYKSKVLILNTIGHLSSIYQYAELVYIGGGFDNGIHNILEPMAFGKTIIFGPNYKKFNEAVETLKLGSNIEVSNEDELKNSFQFLENNLEELSNRNEKNRNFMLANVGATDRIYQSISIFLNN